MNLPPYQIFPNIKGVHISLRQILESDIKDIIGISYYNAVQASSLEQASNMNTLINNDYIIGNTIHWGIVINATNNLVGTCGFYRGFCNEAGELGCVLLPQFMGKGYMSLALELALNFGLNQIGLRRIWASTSTKNKQAISLLTNLNFIKKADLQNGEIEFEYCALV